jgi:N6-adenosine-specific RNA methylase IME4
MSRYRTILADPPWPIAGERGRPWAGKGGRRGHDSFLPYSLMSLPEIEALPVQSLADADAHLFLWVTSAFNREGIGARVARAWGFEPLNEIVWAKRQFGLGRFPRPQHEILLIARRGNLPFTGPKNIGSVQVWPHTYGAGNGGKRHSAKPEAATDLIEQVSPGPYVELFARRQRMGWDSWGLEAFNTAGFEVGA